MRCVRQAILGILVSFLFFTPLCPSLLGGEPFEAFPASDWVLNGWGNNDVGEVGDGTAANVRVAPTAVTGMSEYYVRFAAGDRFSLAVLPDHSVWSWGANDLGQLGTPPPTGSVTPAPVPGIADVLDVAAGDAHALALRVDGSVWAWGANDKGQLGDGTNVGRFTPAPVPGLPTIIAVSAGARHSLALACDGRIYAWGLNDRGQLGDSSDANRWSPVQVNAPTAAFAAIAAGGMHSVALASDGTVWTWGDNISHQLGDDGMGSRSLTPLQVPGFGDVRDIAAGGLHTLALKQNGLVFSWGGNGSGQLGNDSLIDSGIPVQVLGIGVPDAVSSVAAGGDHSLATILNGTAAAWGKNTLGQLGNNSQSPSVKQPGTVVNLTNAVAVAGGQDHSLGLARFTLPTTPAIWFQPPIQNAGAGQSVTLTVRAQGVPPLQYQWYEGLSGNTLFPVPGAILSTMVTPPLSENKTYWVRVSNPGGATNSDTAFITVLDPPSITTQPADLAICNGQTATLTVGATGSAPLHYLWFRGESGDVSHPVYSAVDFNSYMTDPLNATTSFWVRVINDVGEADSNTALVTVRQPPHITSLTSPTPGCPGAPVNLEAIVSGSPPLTFQWYQGLSGDTSTPVGSNSFFLNVNPLVSTPYWVRVSNDCGQENSATILVPVIPPPQVLVQPEPVAVCPGTAAVLSVTASGGGTLHYQWYRGVPGGTSSPVGGDAPSLTLPNPTVTASYWVRVTNACGVADSVAATVTVKQLTHITNQPDPVTINPGATTTLTVTATGEGPLLYQWYQGASGDTSTPVGSNTWNYTTPALSATTAYWVRVTGECGPVDSQTATVTVLGSEGPFTPTYLEAHIGASTTSVHLDWDNTNTAAATLLVERRAGAGGEFDVIVTLPGTATFYEDGGLPPNLTYCYRVRARLGSADSDYSNEACIRLAVCSPPQASTSGSLPSGATGVVLEGRGRSIECPARGYFKYGVISLEEGRTPDQDLGYGQNDIPFSAVLDNLQADVAYKFQAVVVSEGGTAFGEILNFTLHANTWVVTTLSDPLQGKSPDQLLSLREAIAGAEATPGTETQVIVFDPSLPDPPVVELNGPLPGLRRGKIAIDGRIPGTNGGRKVILTPAAGAAAVVPPATLVVTSADNTLSNLVLGGGGGVGIHLTGNQAVRNVVRGCEIGFDSAGRLSPGDLVLSVGILVSDGAGNNRLGLPSTLLIDLAEARDTQALETFGNLVANCTANGILILDPTSVDNQVAGNRIGTADTASVPGNGNGVNLSRAPRNTVGGPFAAYGNAIVGNVLNGVLVTGPTAVGNRISRNAIWGNGLLGIDLSGMDGIGDGPQTSLAQFKRDGPNRFMPSPIIDRFGYEATDVGARYSIWGRTLPHARVEVYEAERDPSGFGEGKRFLAFADADTTGAFVASFLLVPGNYVTLTATLDGDTSEFSTCAQLGVVARDEDVNCLQPRENLLLLAAGYSRDCEVLLGHGLPAGGALNAVLAMDGSSPVPFTVPVMPGRNVTAFPVATSATGHGHLDLELPGTAMPTTAQVQVMADTAQDLAPKGAVTVPGALDGPIPFRIYHVSGQAWQVLDVTVTAAAGTPSSIFPLIKIFGPRAAYLNTNCQNDENTTAFSQVLLPETGDYFVAVGDLYLRQGTGMAFSLTVGLFQNTDTMTDAVTPRDAIDLPGQGAAVAVGDLDGDGWPDLVTAIPELAQLSLAYKTPGTGDSFEAPVSLPLSFTPGAVTLADLDANGRLDILVANPSTGGVYVVFNPGRVTPLDLAKPLRNARAYAGTAAGGDLGSSADFNRDGFADYAQLSSTTGALQIFLNDQSGNLAAGQYLAAGTTPRGMAVADFDGDTVPDIAVADTGGDQVPVFQGAGDGTFSLARTLEGCPSPVDIEAGDYSLDGLTDLLVLNQGNARLQGYFGVGALEFSLAQEHPTGLAPNSLAVNDINVDGYADAAVACSGDGKIYVFMGSAAGLFLPQAILSSTGAVETLVWYSFGNGGAYFSIPPDQDFINALQSTYKTLDFPCAESGGDFDAAFALANPTAEDALVYLSLLGENGTLLTDPTVSNPVTLAIPARQQVSFYVDRMFGDGARNYAPWMRATTQNASVGGFSLLVARSAQLSMDGTAGQTAAAPKQVLPAPGAAGPGADARYSVANPGTVSCPVTVTCRDPNGQAQGVAHQFTLAPGGRKAFDFLTVFPGVTGTAALDVSAGAPVECMVSGGASGMMAALPGLPVPASSAGPIALYMPHFAEGTVFRSVVELMNPGTATAAVTVTAYGDDGSLLGTPGTAPVPAGGMLRSTVAELVGIDPLSAGVISGYLKVVSDRGDLVGCLTFTDRAVTTYAAALPLQRDAGNRFLYSHVAVGTIGGIPYYTGVAVLNTGAADVTGHFTVYDAAGVVRGEADALFPAGRKVSRMLTDFVPGLSDQAGGYVTLTAPAGSNLMSFELFGDAGMHFLSAVPAQPLP
ncbi:MAG: VCBS repeat-containing protein [Acidobacteria bacterium]|nr:VCBS repeat-containing protein [Acidobacteriota bacterium]